MTMTRSILSAGIDSDWKQVTPEKPCPVCGSLDACSVHTFEEFACCSLSPSQWKLTNGAWLHRIGGSLERTLSVEANQTRADSSVIAIHRP